MSRPRKMREGLPTFTARLAGVHAMRAIEGVTHGHVTAVFASVVYVETTAGLFAIGVSDVDHGPLIMVSEMATDWRKIGLKVGEFVNISKPLIRIPGRLAVDMAHVRTWRPSPVELIPETIPLALARLATLPDTPPPEGFGHLCASPAAARPEILRWLASATSGHAAPPEWAPALVGRGPGLTPSGDDLLGGMMIALRALGRTEAADALWSAVRASLPTRTNSVSQALLAAAAEGLGSAALHDTLAALATDSPALAPALARLSGIGHSSGWDALAGVVLTLRAVSPSPIPA